MNRNTLRLIHRAAAVIALATIASFWSSTVVSELFGSHEQVLSVKTFVLYCLPLLIVSMAAAGATGMKMGGKSRHALIANKRKRMPFIAANGLLILLPSAFFLYFRAAAGQFDGVFYGVQILELAAGLTNIILLGRSMKDGFAIRKPKKAAVPSA